MKKKKQLEKGGKGGREGRKIAQVTRPSCCLHELVSCSIMLDRGSARLVHRGGVIAPLAMHG